MLSIAWRMSVACRLLRVAEGLRAVVLAAHRSGACNLGRSDRRGPLQTEVCVRACVRACVRVGIERDSVSFWVAVRRL